MLGLEGESKEGEGAESVPGLVVYEGGEEASGEGGREEGHAFRGVDLGLIGELECDERFRAHSPPRPLQRDTHGLSASVRRCLILLQLEEASSEGLERSEVALLCPGRSAAVAEVSAGRQSETHDWGRRETWTQCLTEVQLGTGDEAKMRERGKAVFQNGVVVIQMNFVCCLRTKESC